MSTLASLCIFFLFLIQIPRQSLAQKGCPFNPQDCTCWSDLSSNPNAFDQVQCESMDKLPSFQSSSGQTFTAKIMSISSPQIDRLPSQYFSIFKSIAQLYLYRNRSLGPIDQSWDVSAFKDTHVDELFLSDLNALFPPPRALITLGIRGLASLSIHRSSDSIRLNESTFEAFSSLQRLSISDVSIRELARSTFIPLETSLTDLSLTGVDLDHFPAESIGNLSRLINLNLGRNRIECVPPNVVENFEELKILNLIGNPLRDDIENGSLDFLPPKLEELNLAETGLEKIPKRILALNSQLRRFYLGRNLIRKIAKADFPEDGQLEVLNFDGNQIEEIEPNAFEKVASSEVVEIGLINTTLETIDLAIFSGIRGELTLNLDRNSVLTNLTISSIDKFPSTAVINLKNTTLRWIDSSLNDLFSAHPSSIRMDISDNVHLYCQDLLWMAPIVLCYSSTLTVDGTRCADRNGQSLIAYLDTTWVGRCRSTTPPGDTVGTSPPNKGWSSTIESARMLFLCLLTLLVAMDASFADF